MSVMFLRLEILIVSVGFCSGQSLTPDQAVERYLTASRNRQPECSDRAFAVQIDASLSKLKKEGSMSGVKMMSRTGQAVYSGLQFSGDKLVKTAVIARFLAKEAKPPDRSAGTDVTRRNYSIVYDRTSPYNDLSAYVFRVKPVRKRKGLFKGELWLDATRRNYSIVYDRTSPYNDLSSFVSSQAGTEAQAMVVIKAAPFFGPLLRSSPNGDTRRQL